MKQIYFLFTVITLTFFKLNAQNASLPVYTEKHLHNQTLTYQETITEYTALTRKFPTCRLTSFGITDVGKPLHLFVISEDRDFLPSSLKAKGKKVLLINNAIHPGEPEGVDASLLLAQKLLHKGDSLHKFLQEVVVLIVPFYNIDGGLVRYCCHRVNQNGPQELGFRGNARNLDLNRDLIKAESQNTQALIRIFQSWDPDLFVDTHTTDGADYPYSMTLITTQLNKIGQPLAGFIRNFQEPFIYKKMAEKKAEIFPYINPLHDSPFEGNVDFCETPRFTTGYAALFQVPGYVAETNKYMPFHKRVEHTYHLLAALLESLAVQGNDLRTVRNEAVIQVKKQLYFDLAWKVDTTLPEKILYKGYPFERKPGPLTGSLIHSYDTSRTVEREINQYRTYIPTLIIDKPQYYLIPQAWTQVIDRLELNGVTFKRLKKDTSLTVSAYYIEDLTTLTFPYEGHYVHSNIKLKKVLTSIDFHRGDYLIPMNQRANYYLMTALEPQSDDSFFAWNFFDAVLNQKEWYTDYKFEYTAVQLLHSEPDLKARFDSKLNAEPEFRSSREQQILFLFRNSKYYEKSHNRYPVYRIENQIQLPVY